MVATKVAVGPFGPLLFPAIRWGVGALLLAALARWREGPFRWPRGAELGRLGLAALCGIVANQILLTESLRLTSADNVSMLVGAAPLGVAGWLAWRGRQRLAPRVWAGLAVGLTGLAIVVVAGGGGRATVAGDVVALGLPVTWTVYLLVLTPLLGRHRPLALAAMVSLVGGLGLIPLGVAEGLAAPPHVTLPAAALLGFSTLGAVVLTGWLYYAGLERLGPTRTAVYGYIQPFLGLVFAAVLIGEPIRLLQLVGGAVVTLGLLAGRPPASGTARAAGEPAPRRPARVATGVGVPACPGERAG